MTDLVLRPAAPADAERVFAWANDPVTRAASFSSAPIPWPEHLAWFTASLARPGRHLLIAEDPGLAEPTSAGSEAACAFLRFDAEPSAGEVGPGRAAVVSINVAPAARGRGVGRRALHAATEAARTLGFDAIIAWIRPDNGASVRAFTAVGYQPAGQGQVSGEVALRFVLRLEPAAAADD